MESAEQAQAVVDELNGKEFHGRTLKVDIAKDRPPRSGGGFNRGPKERNFNR